LDVGRHSKFMLIDWLIDWHNNSRLYSVRTLVKTWYKTVSGRGSGRRKLKVSAFWTPEKKLVKRELCHDDVYTVQFMQFSRYNRTSNYSNTSTDWVHCISYCISGKPSAAGWQLTRRAVTGTWRGQTRSLNTTERTVACSAAAPRR